VHLLFHAAPVAATNYKIYKGLFFQPAALALIRDGVYGLIEVLYLINRELRQLLEWIRNDLLAIIKKA